MQIRSPEEFFDTKGMIAAFSRTGKMDAGDSFHTTGQLYIAKFVVEDDIREDNAKMLAEVIKMCRRYTVAHGEGKVRVQYVRHWDARKWAGQNWIMSRDNLEPMWAALALYAPYNEDCKKYFNEITTRLIQRGGFTWNWKHIWPDNDNHEPKIPDLIFPWDVADRAIRGYRLVWTIPFLLILDLGTLANSIIRVIKSIINPDDTSGDLNHQGRLVFKQLIYYTPTVWLAKMIYKLRRRPNLEPGDESMGSALIEVYQSYYWDKFHHPPAYIWWSEIVRRML